MIFKNSHCLTTLTTDETHETINKLPLLRPFKIKWVTFKLLI